MRIPRRNLIGEEGRGFRYIMRAFQGERLVLSVMMNALCDDVLSETLAYLAGAQGLRETDRLHAGLASPHGGTG